MATAKVYHLKKEKFVSEMTENRFFFDIETAFERDKYEMVAMINVPNGMRIEEAVEHAYALTQNIDNSWIHDTRIQVVPPKEGIRSTMVGDVIEINDMKFLIKALGIKQTEFKK